MRVEVYWNLHRNQWSVRACKTGKIIAHVSSIVLEDVRWVVQPAGNERVRREGKKNVHAFARGTVVDSSTYNHGWSRDNSWTEVTYNPYVDRHFVERTAWRKPITTSKCGLLTHNGYGKPKVWAKKEDNQ